MGPLGQLAAAVFDKGDTAFLEVDFQVEGMVSGPKEDGRFRPGNPLFLK